MTLVLGGCAQAFLCWAASTYLGKWSQSWLDAALESGNEKCKVVFRPDASCIPFSAASLTKHMRRCDDRYSSLGFYFGIVCCALASAVKLKAQERAVKFNQEPTQEVHLPEQMIINYCNWRRQQSPAAISWKQDVCQDSQYRGDCCIHAGCIYI